MVDADTLLHEAALARLYQRYGDAVTRRAWADFDAMFTLDCVLELDLRDRESVHFTGPDAIGSFIEASIERFAFFEFVALTNVFEVDLEAGRAAGRLYLQEMRQLAETGRRTDAFGVYHDLFVLDDTCGWRFRHRRYSSFSRTNDDPGADQVVFDLRALDLCEMLENWVPRSS